MRQRLILSIFALMALFGLVPERAFSQGIPSDGREFWLGYIRGTDRIYWGQYNGYFALVSSYVAQQVTVNYFDEDGKEVQGQSYSIGEKAGRKIPLDRGKMRGTLTGEDIAYRAAVIRSQHPINVQFYSEGSFNGALYQAYPTPTLGRKYVIASHFDAPAANGIWSGDSASSTFMIIAPFDNTDVVITPQSTTMGGRTGVNAGKGATGVPKPYTIRLNRGQTYQVLSPPVDRDHDMSGSTIESSKPISVIAGHQRALIGDPGEAAANLDADYRDMAVEQMIPVESWEREGYISIPFYEVPYTNSMYSGGKGDLYRFYTYEQSDQVEVWQGGINAPYTYQLGKYAYTNPERDNVETSVNVRSTYGKKINVVQYDLFQGELHGSWATGYMSPGMCNVIPERKWRHNYIWTVPTDSRLKGGQYLNIIAPVSEIDKIEVIINNSGVKPLSALPRLKTFTIPQRPDLRGYQLKAGPGTYVAQSKGRFIAYVYGFENGGYKDNYGYVSSVGAAFGSGDETLVPEIEIIPNCSSWDVIIKDERPTDEGIAQIELLNDPDGYIKQPGYVSTNVRMNPGQPVFEPGEKRLSFKLEVLNPFKDAYAAVWVVDRAGNDTVYEFTYRAPSFTATPDSIDMGALAVGQEKCSTFTFTNTASPGGQAVRVEDVRLLFGNQDITIKSVSRALPANLLAGESLTVDVCFTAKDAPFPHVDSLVLKTDCFEAKLEIKGKGLAPLIYAYDVDFGTVSVGGKKCLPVKVENRGTAPFTLTKDWVLHNTTDFEFADFDKLPIVLDPGESVELEFCYKPDAISDKDSTHTDWGTDMVDPFKGKEKDWSFLRGNAVAPEAVWTEDIMFLDAECSKDTTTRIYITNILNTTETITDVTITGEDANEFSFVRNEHGWVIPSAGYPLDPGDTVWFDVTFTPDLTKPFTKTRRATITAITLVGRDDTIQMAGHVFYADMQPSQTTPIDFGKKLGGEKERRTVSVKNTGTTGLIIKSISVSDPAFTIISGPAVGDKILANTSFNVEIEATAPTTGSVQGELIITGETDCPTPAKFDMTMGGYDPSAQGTGLSAPMTFVCKDNSGTVEFQNGQESARLDRVEILPGPYAAHFTFANGTQTLVMNKTLVPGAKEVIPVTFRPTSVIPAGSTATIRYTWTDLIGNVTSTIDQPLTGGSRVITNTLSVEKEDKTVYSADPMERFTVDVKMLEDIIPEGEIKKVTFGLSYRQDLFRFEGFESGVGFTARETGAPTVVDLTETRWFEIEGDVTAQDVLGTLEFTLLVARDLESPFDIIEPKMFAADGLEACYVTVDKIPASFIPREFCGTQVLRNFLNDLPPTSIISMSPNPAKDVITVTYDVNISESPVSIEVYDLLGTKVLTVMDGQTQLKGRHTEVIDASGLASGNYTIRFQSQGKVSSRQLQVKH